MRSGRGVNELLIHQLLGLVVASLAHRVHQKREGELTARHIDARMSAGYELMLNTLAATVPRMMTECLQRPTG